MGTMTHGLLMDLDGTIADTLPHLFRSFRHAVEPWVTRAPSDAEVVATWGPTERECIARMLSDRNYASPETEARLDEANCRFHAYYAGHDDEIQAFPSIPQVIRFARENGWRFAVFTGKARHSAVLTLERLKLWPFVECLVAGDDVSRAKPDPEGVLAVARQLDLPPHSLLVVGDMPADILAGKTAGARTAAALWGTFNPEATRAAGPDWTLDRVEQLPTILDEISARRSRP